MIASSWIISKLKATFNGCVSVKEDHLICVGDILWRGHKIMRSAPFTALLWSTFNSIECSEKQQTTIQSFQPTQRGPPTTKYILTPSCGADLDVVEVDLRQTTVVVMDPLHGLLHVGGVWGLFRKDLEGILFYNTYIKKHFPKQTNRWGWENRSNQY